MIGRADTTGARTPSGRWSNEKSMAEAARRAAATLIRRPWGPVRVKAIPEKERIAALPVPVSTAPTIFSSFTGNAERGSRTRSVPTDRIDPAQADMRFLRASTDGQNICKTSKVEASDASQRALTCRKSKDSVLMEETKKSLQYRQNIQARSAANAAHERGEAHACRIFLPKGERMRGLATVRSCDNVCPPYENQARASACTPGTTSSASIAENPMSTQLVNGCSSAIQ